MATLNSSLSCLAHMKEQGLREYSQTQRASKGQLRIQKEDLLRAIFRTEADESAQC
jgi:hypothetical protein